MTKKQQIIEIMGLCNSCNLTPKELLLLSCLIENKHICEIFKSTSSNINKVEMVRNQGGKCILTDVALDKSLSLIELLFDSNLIIFLNYLIVDAEKELLDCLPKYRLDKEVIREIYEIKT